MESGIGSFSFYTVVLYRSFYLFFKRESIEIASRFIG